jgi:hypothetical protein
LQDKDTDDVQRCIDVHVGRHRHRRNNLFRRSRSPRSFKTGLSEMQFRRVGEYFSSVLRLMPPYNFTTAGNGNRGLVERDFHRQRRRIC